jgi:hypothetical protein
MSGRVLLRWLCLAAAAINFYIAIEPELILKPFTQSGSGAENSQSPRCIGWVSQVCRTAAAILHFQK